MYILVSFNHERGNCTKRNKWNKISNDDLFTCSILDTSDFVIESFTRKQLEEIIRIKPDVDIQGVSHKNGIITDVYYADNGDFIHVRDFGLLYERRNLHGTSARCRVIKRGIERILYTYDTPNWTYDNWWFELKLEDDWIKVYEHAGKSTTFERWLEFNGKDIGVFIEPTQNEVDRVKARINL